MDKKCNEIVLRPSDIRYTQSTISNKFSDGTLIGNLLDDIVIGRCFVSAIKRIEVKLVDGVWYSADNRRLWVFKQLEFLGHCPLVTVKTVKRIDWAKCTSANGGIDVSLRGGQPGGIWYSKVEEIRQLLKHDSSVSDKRNNKIGLAKTKLCNPKTFSSIAIQSSKCPVFQPNASQFVRRNSGKVQLDISDGKQSNPNANASKSTLQVKAFKQTTDVKAKYQRQTINKSRLNLVAGKDISKSILANSADIRSKDKLGDSNAKKKKKRHKRGNSVLREITFDSSQTDVCKKKHILSDKPSLRRKSRPTLCGHNEGLHDITNNELRNPKAIGLRQSNARNCKMECNGFKPDSVVKIKRKGKRTTAKEGKIKKPLTPLEVSNIDSNVARNPSDDMSLIKNDNEMHDRHTVKSQNKKRKRKKKMLQNDKDTDFFRGQGELLTHVFEVQSDTQNSTACSEVTDYDVAMTNSLAYDKVAVNQRVEANFRMRHTETSNIKYNRYDDDDDDDDNDDDNDYYYYSNEDRDNFEDNYYDDDVVAVGDDAFSSDTDIWPYCVNFGYDLNNANDEKHRNFTYSLDVDNFGGVQEPCQTDSETGYPEKDNDSACFLQPLSGNKSYLAHVDGNDESFRSIVETCRSTESTLVRHVYKGGLQSNSPFVPHYGIDKFDSAYQNLLQLEKHFAEHFAEKELNGVATDDKSDTDSKSQLGGPAKEHNEVCCIQKSSHDDFNMTINEEPNVMSQNNKMKVNCRNEGETNRNKYCVVL